MAAPLNSTKVSLHRGTCDSPKWGLPARLVSHIRIPWSSKIFLSWANNVIFRGLGRGRHFLLPSNWVIWVGGGAPWTSSREVPLEDGNNGGGGVDDGGDEGGDEWEEGPYEPSLEVPLEDGNDGGGGDEWEDGSYGSSGVIWWCLWSPLRTFFTRGYILLVWISSPHNLPWSYRLTKGRLRLCRSTWPWSVLTDRRAWQDEPGDLLRPEKCNGHDDLWLIRLLNLTQHRLLGPSARPLDSTGDKRFQCVFQYTTREKWSKFQKTNPSYNMKVYDMIYHTISFSAWHCFFGHHQLENTNKRATFIFLWLLKWL